MQLVFTYARPSQLYSTSLRCRCLEAQPYSIQDSMLTQNLATHTCGMANQLSSDCSLGPFLQQAAEAILNPKNTSIDRDRLLFELLDPY